MFDEDLKDSSVDVSNGARKPKKPIPLPRKHIPKVENNDESDGSSGSGRSANRKLENFFSYRNEKRSASEIVHEKKRMVKNEVQKLEKSVRNMISKRSISFNSPLSDDVKCTEDDLKGTSESDVSSNDESNYTSDLPPPYPPPDLPDESIYDEATSVTSSDGQCSYLPSSDSNSLYEDLSKYQTVDRLSKCNLGTYDNVTDGPAKSDSWTYYDSVGNSDMRYEVISESTDNDPFSFSYHPPSEILKPDPYDSSENTRCDEVPVAKPKSFSSSVVHQFDPLSEKEPESPIDLMSEISESFKSLLKTIQSNADDGSEERNLKNPFQNPVILSSLSEEEGNACEVSSSAKEQLSCLIEGHYGKVRKCEKLPSELRKSAIELSEEYDVELPPSFTPPPVPPRRFDSIEPKTDEVDKRRTSIIRWSSMKRVAKMVAENIENRTSWSSSSLISDRRKTDKKPEPEGKVDNCAYLPVMLNHSGVLFKSGGIQRWGVLSQRKLTLFANKDSPDVKETIPIDSVLSIKAVNDSKICVEGVQVYCFEISVNSKNQSIVLGAPSASERHIWMRKLLESLTQNFPVKLMSDYLKAGLCYAKVGISSEWTQCSLLLHSRTLYLSPKSGVLSVADLRKARYLTLQTNDQTCKTTSERGPMLLIDIQDRTIYLQMDYVRETKAWESVIVAAALENGPSLSEQQLTKDDVPTIVEKCVNFIHTHGSLSEGIYRRNGSNQAVTKLLSALRSDAWAIQLTKQNYNEFDVSSVLKRFFRDLPEPLFVSAIHSELRSITENHTDNLEEKLEKYAAVLKKLPNINYITAKRLIGHLYFIDKQREKNLMGVENLAAIWGPTLLHVQGGVSLDPNWSRVESSVLNDLITHFPSVFEVDKAELDREMKILQVLENYHNNSNHVQSKKRSGGPQDLDPP
ncbi:UNVERIFIED_CONTAM: hypothetical protein PYX00_001209 [Menopon gallinae]|uniref:Uncharacterized protein n=1 Tax=Menopon gallinae TaxID=328185 RepID=A0AAW2ICR8_9NEOP